MLEKDGLVLAGELARAVERFPGLAEHPAHHVTSASLTHASLNRSKILCGVLDLDLCDHDLRLLGLTCGAWRRLSLAVSLPPSHAVSFYHPKTSPLECALTRDIPLTPTLVSFYLRDLRVSLPSLETAVLRSFRLPCSFDASHVIPQALDEICASSAACTGPLDLLRHLLTDLHCPVDEGACEGAAADGRLECLRFLHEFGCPWTAETTRAAMRHGSVECLEYAVTQGCPVTRWVCCGEDREEAQGKSGRALECLRIVRRFGGVEGEACEAAKEGNLECMREVTRGWESETVCVNAAREGSMECLRFAVEEKGSPLSEECWEVAAGWGKLECLRYLNEMGCPRGRGAAVMALRNGHQECLEYLEEIGGLRWPKRERYERYHFDRASLDGVRFCHERGMPLVSSMCRCAATYDRVDVMRYCVRHGYPCDLAEAAGWACRGSSLRCLEYLRQNGVAFNSDHCAIAAHELSGYDCLVYLHSVCGAPIDEEASRNAAGEWLYDPRLLQFCHEHGKWDWRTCAAAMSKGSIGALRFAHEHGCPWDAEVCASETTLQCLSYAHAHGCPWDERACEAAASNGDLGCLKYAHEHGCPLGEGTCEAAARTGHLSCLQYAHEQGCPWSCETTTEAAVYSRLACFKYALENGCPLGNELVHDHIRSLACRNFLTSWTSSHK